MVNNFLLLEESVMIVIVIASN